MKDEEEKEKLKTEEKEKVKDENKEEEVNGLGRGGWMNGS